MYKGDNGASCVYMSCITSDPHMSTKMFFKSLYWSIRAIVSKWGILSLQRDKGRPSMHDVRGVVTHAITVLVTFQISINMKVESLLLK